MQLDPRDQEKQTTFLVTYTENRVTIDHDIGRALIDTEIDYRTPLLCESRTYELTAIGPPRRQRPFHVAKILLDAGTRASPLDYEQEPTAGRLEKRLVERVRTYYRRNDLTGPLPLGELQSLALPVEKLQACFHARPAGHDLPREVAPICCRLAAEVLGGTGAEPGGYVDLDSDGAGGFPPAACTIILAQNPTRRRRSWPKHARHFFLPRRYRDPFGPDIPVVTYDHDLLVGRTRATHSDNRVHVAANDYRVLQPGLVTDPNGNRTAGGLRCPGPGGRARR